MRKIQVLFPGPQLDRLRRRALIEDRPIADLIRRAAEEYLSRLPDHPQPDPAKDLPAFDGGRLRVSWEALRAAAWSERTGGVR